MKSLAFKLAVVLIVYALTVTTILPVLVEAQSGQLWVPSSNYAKLIFSNYGLQVPKLGSTGNPCLTVGATGRFATTTCSGGSGTVNSGTAGQLSYYASNGTTVSGTSTLFITNNTFSVYPSLGAGSQGFDFFADADEAQLRMFGNNDASFDAYANDGSSFLELENSNTSKLWIEPNGTESYLIGTTNFGIGTSTPSRKLTVAGTMRLTGALYDRVNSAGTSGRLLQTTGSGVQWVATSSLGISATPAGSDTSIQFNDGGSFGGTNLLYTEPLPVLQITVKPQTVADEAGLTFDVEGGRGLGSGAGGDLVLNSGQGGDTGPGGSVFLGALAGGITSGDGGNITLSAGGSILGDGGGFYADGGDSQDGNGGNLQFSAGDGTGSGNRGGDLVFTGGAGISAADPGDIVFFPTGTVRLAGTADFSIGAILDANSINTTSKTFTFPNQTGTIALTSDIPAGFGTTSINTSAKLRSILTDETGSGLAVFGTAPTLSSTTISGILKLSTQTASRALFTDALSRATTTAASLALAGSLSDETGSGRVVFSASPAFSGTLTASSITATGTIDFGGAVSTEIVNGSSPTVDATGECALDTTSGQLKCYDGGIAEVYGDGHTYRSFTIIATTSAFTGTTTWPLGPSYLAETWNGLKCFTDVGTIRTRINDGTNFMNVNISSTTVGTTPLSSNNTFTAGEKRYVQLANPASSPTKLACTVDTKLTAD